jgi:1,5-anhydro-D-fructose reductase (1,5-anhydro-D-mannitol-forming)
MRDSGEMIGWGILGGGRVVESKSGPGFLIPGKSRVMAVSRRNLDDAKMTAVALGAQRAVTNIEDLVSDPEVDAVYIASLPGLHFDAARVCCDAGKPVYVEKPFVTNTSDARALVEMFSAKGIGLFVAHYRRALPKFKTLKSKIDSEIGRVVSFDFYLSRRLSDAVEHAWLFEQSLSGGGKFADIAAHSIDLLVYFFGRAVDMWACARHVMAPNGREDCVVLAIRFENGVCGTLNYNFLSPEKDDRLSIFGTEANLHFSVHGKKKTEIEDKNGTRQTIDLSIPACIEAPMIEEVVKVLLGEQGRPCTGSDAIETIRIMEYALGSLCSD